MIDFISENLSLEHTLGAKLLLETAFPHEALTYLKNYVIKIGEKLDPDVYEKKSEGIWIARNASVAPSAFIASPCIIGENTEIRHCAYLRGAVIIGNSCIVGNSTEVKNSIIFDGVQIPHYNYVGDSILGYKSHLGAGAITSNVKSDRSLIRVDYGKERIETDRKKLGAILGDGVEVGCGAVLNPGTVIGRDTRIYPLSSVRGFVPPKAIYKSQNGITDII